LLLGGFSLHSIGGFSGENSRRKRTVTSGRRIGKRDPPKTGLLRGSHPARNLALEVRASTSRARRAPLLNQEEKKKPGEKIERTAYSFHSASSERMSTLGGHFKSREGARRHERIVCVLGTHRALPPGNLGKLHFCRRAEIDKHEGLDEEKTKRETGEASATVNKNG